MKTVIKHTKAAILTKLNKPLIIDKVELPDKLLRGQILVKMKYSGICGSQLGEIDGVKGKDNYLPHLLGHEAIAKVIQTGSSVKKVKKGDKVLLHWMPADGIDAKTATYKWRNKALNSGKITTFSNYSIVSENRVSKINRSGNDLDLLLLGCTASTAIGSVKKLCKIETNQTTVVAGCGPIGLYLIKYLNYLNVKKIISIDINKKKLELSKKFGATHMILNSKKIQKKIQTKLKKNIDYFFECTGNSKIISLGYECLKTNGSMILIGVPHYKSKASINTLGINLGKKLLGSKGGKFNPSKDLKNYSKLVSLKKLNSKNFILKRIKLDKVNKVFSEMRQNKILGKAIIEF